MTWTARVAMVLVFVGSASAFASEQEDLAFFEKKVRPVLVEKCYRCHSAEAQAKGKLRGGLLLDTKQGLLKGGDSGPAIEPGNPDDSFLIQAVRYDDLVLMPPEGKLPDEVIADLARWVKDGAVDPRADSAPQTLKAGSFDLEQARAHWAYQLPKDSPAPEVSDQGWPVNDIDRFILARLESEGLQPVAEADRETLARRLYFDLHGLPPTPEEIRAFQDDPARDAYERLVDRLLASPRFGQKWGRHWLDVARFGESLTLRGLVLPDAWRYRDYVIEVFNADRPYDQFVREQVAGDLLPADSLPERQRQLVATTFLMLGNTNLEAQDKEQLDMDVVDEQIDTLGKAFLAQTVGCARCHDHKFDPIPTADYYALAGIFHNVSGLEHANVSHWLQRPMPLPKDQEKALKKYEARLAALQKQVKAERQRLKKKGAVGVVKAASLPGVVVDDSKARRVGEWKASTFSGTFIEAGYLHDENDSKGLKSLTFEPQSLKPGEYEVRLAFSSGSGRARKARVLVGSADGEDVVLVDMSRPPRIAGRFVSLGRHRFEKDGLAYVLVSNEGTSGFVTADAVQFVPVDQAETEDSASEGQDTLHDLESALKKLEAKGLARPTVMSVVERETIEESHVLIRGNVHSPGEPVGRGFLRAASYGPDVSMPGDESGRRELAEWLTSRRNPLTARVMVNRAWHWLMGAGLVRTVDNFGTTGEEPSHPELLDHLAVQFMDEGWSVKALVKSIVLSRTYRLSAREDPEVLKVDPENRLRGHHDRRRLEAEEIRDAMLWVSGRLDDSMGGPGFPEASKSDYGFQDASRRRSVYVPVFRNALPEVFQVFDFANPSLVVGRRDASTVAPQALFLMNSPFVREQAQMAAKRLLDEPGLSGNGVRLERAYRRVLGRPPTDQERRAVRKFLDQSGEDRPEDTWTMVFQALFASMDFRYVN